MLISELNQHCGECGLIEYCGNPFGFCLCHDARFSDMNEDEYLEIAQDCKLEIYEGCKECIGMDDCILCDKEDERKNFECELIADQVAQKNELAIIQEDKK